MTNPYLDKVWKTVVPFTNSPVTFYYNQVSDGSSGFAMYDTASGKEISSCSYPAHGTPSTADAAAAVTTAAAMNPLAMLASLSHHLFTPDASAGSAPAPAGMLVFPLPFPIVPACWLPTSGSIGIAIVLRLTNPVTVLCYRACTINPMDHTFTIAQDIGPFKCALVGKLDYQGDVLKAIEGRFVVTLGSTTVFDQGMTIPA
jgi:hypothetical protein